MSLRINPEYEKLLPQMTAEEFNQLKTSISEEGQHYPIIVNEDLEVLDGHHRFKACIELGVEPDFEVRKFDNKLREKKFVIEANLRRRNLNNFQLVELAAPLLEIEKAMAKERKSEGGKIGRNLQLGLMPNDTKPILNGKATEVVAKKIGLSTRTFERGKKILEEGSEEDKQMLREGKSSIAKIYKEIVSPKLESKPDLQTLKSDHEDELFAQNKATLESILKSLNQKQLFCPECKNSMFECSHCHKTIEYFLLKSKENKNLPNDDEHYLGN